jgi:hypothetical protein
MLLTEATAGCPAQIVRTYPADGATHRPGERIGADLDLTMGAGADLASLRLAVDSTDVTSRATVTASRDWPPSRVSISHGEAIAPGQHRVEMRFRTSDGRTLSCAWSFVSRP